MPGKWRGAVLALLALGGCAGPGNLKQLTCPQTCNRDYDVCSESTGAARGGASFFGAGAACQRQLAACLKNCELDAAEAKPAPKDEAKPVIKDQAKPAPKDVAKTPGKP